jgi:hypothetical protein
VAQEIAGHANESMTYGLYGKKLEPAVQLQYLSQIDFQIDLCPLKDVWRKLMPAGRKS